MSQDHRSHDRYNPEPWHVEPSLWRGPSPMPTGFLTIRGVKISQDMEKNSHDVRKAVVCGIKIDCFSSDHLHTILNIEKLEHELGFHKEKSETCWRCQDNLNHITVADYLYDPEIERIFYK